MNIFKNLSSEGLEEVEDRLGGYQPLESGIYKGTVKALYGVEAASGAVGMDLIVDINGQEYRERLWVTNRNKQNYWVTPNGKKSPLPGYSIVEDILMVTTETPLNQQNIEEKVVKVWDPETRSELPKSVPMFVDVIGKEVALGILKQLVNKREKQGNEYVEVAESREENVIDKVFHPELKVTVNEAKNGRDPTFWDSWEARNAGVTRDRRKIKEGSSGAPQSNRRAPGGGGGSSSPSPRTSLFGK